MTSFMMSLPFSMQQCVNRSDMHNRSCRRFHHLHFSSGILAFPALQGDMFSSGKKNRPCFSNLLRKSCIDDSNHLEVEIISENCIKPTVPTPEYLRIYEVSILDQLFPHAYTSFVYFYSNYHQNDSTFVNLNDLTTKRIQLLKQSLSETLTRFYPLAGKVKDYRHIDCNDEGVYCVEAKVNQSVSNFLSEPGKKFVEPLLPFGTNPMEFSTKTFVLMIQLTTFSCGGISIGLCASHKIMDAYSYATFLRAWAAVATASLEDIYPQFVSPFIFPSTPTIPDSTSLLMLPLYLKQGKSTTKRFVFPASSLAQLKRKGGASRVLSVSGLIWKCAIKALKARSAVNDSIKKTSALSMAVNLRGRSFPPMPQNAMGNIIWPSLVARCWEGVDFGLDSYVQCIKNSVDRLNAEFVESMKGDKGLQKVEEYLNEVEMFYSKEDAEYILITSMCNSGMYEADFGWGKPLWFSSARPRIADPNVPQLTNVVQLMDTSHGDGIEAWVTLSAEDMVVFEQDPELLEVSSIDPNPLEYLR